MTAGVPQGSVLGPTLWNLAYDDVLRLPLSEGVKTIAYADDLAVLVAGKEIEDVETKANWALEDISTWMREHSLELAPEKSEAVVLLKRKKDRSPKLQVDGHPIRLATSVRYLGVMLEKDKKIKEHIRVSTLKASVAATKIARILPRTYGASEAQRRVLATVAESIALYGSPVWGPEALKHQYNKDSLEKCQRIMAIRITRGYRTVSTKALFVLARTIPWPLLIQQRISLYQEKKRSETPAEEEDESANRIEEQINEDTFNSWQREWDQSDKGRLTYASIPDIRPWYERKHGELTYYLTQVLTGHGNFNSYLDRIKKVDSPKCGLCGKDDEDNVHHTIIECEAFKDIRGSWRNMTVPKILGEMLLSSQAWEMYRKIIEKIMRSKERKQAAAWANQH